MRRKTLEKNKANQLDPIEIIPPGFCLKVSAARSNSGNVRLGSSRRKCHERGQHVVLEPGGYVSLSIDSSGRVFPKGDRDGQVISYGVVEGGWE